ncbi:MAG: HAD-IC family P-type ATPase, partial [Caldimonas sp.]
MNTAATSLADTPVSVAAPRHADLLSAELVKPALRDAFVKLHPAQQWRNPVMFVVYVGAILITVLWIQAMFAPAEAPAWFIGANALWLWFTVLFANFAEALAEGRSKAQAASLRGLKKRGIAKRLAPGPTGSSGAAAGKREPARGGTLAEPRHGAAWIPVGTDELRIGAVVLVEAGDGVPCDGDVIEGVASVDESAITGESAPVIREAGGDFSSVTGGTRVLSDWIVVRCTVNPGEAFIDRMIAMVEGAKRRKTPNEVALTILLVALTLVFLFATVTLLPYSLYAVDAGKSGVPVTITVLVALLVCLIPTTIGGLLSAIGVAGMSRMLGANVIATSGRAVEAAGDVDVLLLDKTGTITLGNRQAASFAPAPGIGEEELADAAQLASLADETPEGRSIVVLAKQKFDIRERALAEHDAVFVPFTAQTRMSGVDWQGRQIRKGAADAIRQWLEPMGCAFPAEVSRLVDEIARRGSTPLVVAEGGMRGAAGASSDPSERDDPSAHEGATSHHPLDPLHGALDPSPGGASGPRVLGVVELKDIVKGGIKERFRELRRMGIKTVMITGDNKLTAAAIGAEAGVDDVLAEATPEAKLALIRKYQADGYMVAMTGDGTNDAPALAQADVAVAMNSGTQAAKEAG